MRWSFSFLGGIDDTVPPDLGLPNLLLPYLLLPYLLLPYLLLPYLLLPYLLLPYLLLTWGRGLHFGFDLIGIDAALRCRADMGAEVQGGIDQGEM
jgi:hypothetical protein